MVEKVKGVAGNIKVAIVTGVATIVCALIGAWQVAVASNNDQSLTPASRTEVRQMIQNEAPVNARDADQLFVTLARIDGKITQLQVQVAEDHVLIKQLVQGR